MTINIDVKKRIGVSFLKTVHSFSCVIYHKLRNEPYITKVSTLAEYVVKLCQKKG